MTFLQSSVGDGCEHKEYDLALFNYTASLSSSSSSPLKRRYKTDIVQILSTKVHPCTIIQIRFDTVKEAQDFKLLYESSHSPAPQLDFPSTVSWPSHEPTPSDSTWQESSPPKLDDFDIGPGSELPWDTESSRSQASTVVEYGVTRESEEDQDPRGGD